MAIRDRFRRAMHKSENISTSDNGNMMTNTITSNSDSSEGSSPLRKTPSTKLFNWRSQDSAKQQKKEESKSTKSKKASSSNKPMHPRDKPLSATNMRHQEMLSSFSMTFGSSPNRLSQLVTADDFDEEGVSPCCTRHPSFDGGMVDFATSHDGSSTSLETTDGVPPPKVNNTMYHY